MDIEKTGNNHGRIMKPIHILLTDDKTQITLSLPLILKKSGFKVTIASDKLSALNKIISLSNSTNPIDLHIMDIDTPGLPAWKFIDELAMMDLVIPTIFTTGSSQYKNFKREPGFIEIISKPFNIEELLQLIKQIIEDANNLVKTKQVVGGENE